MSYVAHEVGGTVKNLEVTGYTLPPDTDLIIDLQNDGGLTYDPISKVISSWISGIGDKSFTPVSSSYDMFADATLPLNGNPSIKSLRQTNYPILQHTGSFGDTTQELTTLIICRLLTREQAYNGGSSLYGSYGASYVNGNRMVYAPYTDGAHNYGLMTPNDDAAYFLDLGADIRDGWHVIVKKTYVSGIYEHHRVFVDGVETGYSQGRVVAGGLVTAEKTTAYIGSYPTNDYWGFTGNVAALLVWKGSASDAQCIAASNFYMNKYGLI